MKYIDLRIKAHKEGFDYALLQRLLKKISGDNRTFELKDNQENELDNIKKEDIIPIVGLPIPMENDEHDWKAPSSDWIAPHGPQWTPINY